MLLCQYCKQNQYVYQINESYLSIYVSSGFEVVIDDELCIHLPIRHELNDILLVSLTRLLQTNTLRYNDEGREQIEKCIRETLKETFRLTISIGDNDTGVIGATTVSVNVKIGLQSSPETLVEDLETYIYSKLLVGDILL
jgi:hypothetical protein